MLQTAKNLIILAGTIFLGWNCCLLYKRICRLNAETTPFLHLVTGFVCYTFDIYGRLLIFWKTSVLRGISFWLCGKKLICVADNGFEWNVYLICMGDVLSDLYGRNLDD